MFSFRVLWDRKELERKLQAAIEREATKTKTKTLQALRDATPVDTGRARDSWSASDTSPEGEFTVTNSVDYIGPLNHGHSKQAPSYFIERVALAFGKAVGQVVNYLNRT